MPRLTRRQREFLADKALDIANLVAGGIVLAFFWANRARRSVR
jgi:hypothetical protein